MKVLLLGGAGYIGSVLTEYLIEKGEEVIVFDTLLYEKKVGKNLPYKIIRGDISNINDLLPVIEEADCVVNLAAISNDPASDLQPELTWQINYKANELIANLCEFTGKRVVFASSCSVYGFAEKGVFSENSKLNPVTLYARTKMLSEKFYLNKNVNAIILRFATVYGVSPKVRFDLVVNTMIGSGFFKKEIVVNGGDQWRPLVHVKDVCEAIYKSIKVRNPKYRVFNIGSDKQNYKIYQLGEVIASKMKGVKFIHKKDSIDTRSYQVDFSRAKKILNFVCSYSIADAVEEFKNDFSLGKIKNMSEDRYYRVKYLKNYLEDKILVNQGIFSQIKGRK